MKFILTALIIITIVSCSFDDSKRVENDRSVTIIPISYERLDRIDGLNLKGVNDSLNRILDSLGLDFLDSAIYNLDTIKSWAFIDTIDIWDSSEGGRAVLYYNWDWSSKISLTRFGENGKQFMDFYLYEDELLFSREITIIYNRPIYWDSLKMMENNDNQIFNIEKSDSITKKSYFIKSNIQLQKVNNKFTSIDKDYLNEENIRILNEYNKLEEKFDFNFNKLIGK